MPVALEQPGDQRPAARGGDPRVSGLPRDQRADGEGERHGETDVPQVQHRRMDGHRRILQQRAETVAVRHRGDQLVHRQHLERIGDEVVEDEEEGLDRHQHRGDARHHVAMLAAVGEDDDRGVGGEQETPEQQRPFLPAPPRRELVQHRHGAVAVRGDIGETEIAGQQAVDQDAGRQVDQSPHRVNGALPADHQKRLALDASDDGGKRRVQRDAERQQNCQRTQIFHKSP